MLYGYEEAKTNVIKIEDIEEEVMEKFVGYIKTGNVEINHEVAENLFYAANKYDVQKLKTNCGAFLGQTLNKDNALSRLTLAFMHNDASLKQNILNFIAANFANKVFKEILKTENWIKLASDNKELYDEIVDAIFDRFSKI